MKQKTIFFFNENNITLRRFIKQFQLKKSFSTVIRWL